MQQPLLVHVKTAGCGVYNYRTAEISQHKEKSVHMLLNYRTASCSQFKKHLPVFRILNA